MRKVLLFLLTWFGVTLGIQAQETFPTNDVRDQRSKAYAFTNATIYTDHQTKLEKATLLIRDGKIEQVGTNVSIPKGYTTMDLEGAYIYPSFIDMHTNYGTPEIKRGGGSRFGGPEQIQSDTKGPYNANEAIKAEYNTFAEFEVKSKDAKTWRNMGFGSVLAFRPDGVARGTSVFVTLANGNENTVILNSKAAAHYSFNRGSSSQSYPVSAMGYIALLRQTYMDAEWYHSHTVKPFTDESLEAWKNNQGLPQIFDTNNWLSMLRADKVGDEFGVQYIIKGATDAYKRIDEIKAMNAPLIIPVNFPTPYNVDDPLDTYQISLADMKHWELAPTNLGRLEKAGIEFAITTDDLKKKTQFWPNVRKAVKMGLSEAGALKAMTGTPAKLLGMDDKIGMLQPGYVANFIVTSGSVFESDVVIYENWIQGNPYVIKERDQLDLAGNYKLKVGDDSYDLKISGEAGKHKAEIPGAGKDDKATKVTLKEDDGVLTMIFKPAADKKMSGDIRLTGWTTGKNLEGQGQMPDGTWVNWMASFDKALEAKKEDDKKKKSTEKEEVAEVGDVIFPFAAYGSKEVPKAQKILIKNATVWTMEQDKSLEGTDVLLENGKIAQIGKNLSASGAKVIDGTGKHLTPGIIDEHSHIAATSINDVATNSSMVRIMDVIDSEDQEIYRALSGGVTAIQILHGSANPIGGQSGLIKLRWGAAPEELKIKDSDGFIKFALGENVKRSRSSSSIRYPQTRMGVEQVFVDAFTAALDYEKKWNAYNAMSDADKAKTQQPRRDLAMDAMVEIIRNKRFISCHSYVQSEINMLMKVAEQFGFKINTFTHILEGYKVADKMAAHGAGGSSFADWWNYKWEVRYAIPYNNAVMTRAGVVTAVNSDDAEMMRRLNQEAAKTIKYGDMSEVEALAMVTINPAKLLHLDDRMGSIRVGKDADVVLWSDHPLSIYAKPEKTIVDGTIYYDIEEDAKKKVEIEKERARLVEKMRSAKGGPGKGRMPAKRSKHHFHCDDVVTHRE